ncbi:MAG: TIR domain-containing protein [Bacteroidetes bacterium]|nr:TIR domain-containing protein [Bacteroidota bacterium]
MARYVFFSFAYDDVKNFKVNVVRHSWLINKNEETFIDGSIWEKDKTKGSIAIMKLIENGLNKTSVTAILIGEETANRRWVNYELIKSFDRGNGILGVYINRIRGKQQAISARGLNPLDRLAFQISEDGRKIRFYELINRKWVVYSDLPEINNKKSNTLYFEDSFWKGNDFGKSFRFSEMFNTFCWINDDGHKNFSSWVEEAANEAGR